MQISLRGSVAALFSGALLLAACGGELPVASVSAPEGPRSAIATLDERALPLTRAVPLSEDVVVRSVIGRGGGTISVAGLTLTVPANAVRERTTFVVTALAGSAVAYEFEPHGAVFGAPLTFEQDLQGTNWSAENAGSLEGAYFADRSQVDRSGRASVVNEWHRADVSVRAAKVRFGIRHFSGYLVSWGRGSKGQEAE